jgi:hypothetical protein
MYVVKDIKSFPKATPQVRKRTQPLNGYNSTLLLNPGTNIELIPANAIIVKNLGSKEGVWEAHLTISNPEIVKRLAVELDAIAWMVRD